MGRRRFAQTLCLAAILALAAAALAAPEGLAEPALAQALLDNPVAAGSIADTGDILLREATKITTFEVDGTVYAIVTITSETSHAGIQILNLSNPAAPTAAGNLSDTADLLLTFSHDAAVFTVSGNTYAAVTSPGDGGVQMLQLADSGGLLANPTAAGNIEDGGGRLLGNAKDISLFEVSGATYAAVAGGARFGDNGVQMLKLTSDTGTLLANPRDAGKIADNNSLLLEGADGIATFEVSDAIYAAVAAGRDDGVQMLKLTNDAGTALLSSPEDAGKIADGGSLLLDGADGIATFEVSGAIYAAVAASGDNGVQMLKLTNDAGTALLANPTDAGNIEDGGSLLLDNPDDITILTASGTIYAAVTASGDNGVQMLKLANSSGLLANPEDAGKIEDDGDTLLESPTGIATFEDSGTTYAAVAALFEDGVQILQLTAAGTPADNTAPTVDAGAAQTVSEGDMVTLTGTATDPDDSDVLTYAWTVSPATPAITINDDDALSTTFTAPEVTTDTDFVFTLTVNDGTVDVSDTVTVTVSNVNRAPIADAGGDLIVAQGVTVMLDGTGSYDPDGGVLDYTWLSIGNVVTLTGGNTATPTFTAPSSTATFIIALVVNDGEHNDRDEITVTVPALPVSDAGSDVPALAGDTVALNGTGSTGTALTYFWNQTAGPDVTLDFIDVRPVGWIGDTEPDGLLLHNPLGVAAFEHGGTPYVVAAANVDNAVQVIDMSDPASPAAVGNLTDGDSRELSGPRGIDIFEHGGTIYAAVTAERDDGVEIVSLADPANPAGVGRLTNDNNRELNGPRGIDIFELGGTAYAAVAGRDDDGVQIISLADPANPAAAGKIGRGANVQLDNPEDVAVFGHSGATYAAVTATNDDTVLILKLTDGSGQLLADPVVAGLLEDNSTLALEDPRNIDIFEAGGTAYAAVASSSDHGVQIISLADPANPAAAGKIVASDGSGLHLGTAYGIDIFEVNGAPYAAVTAQAGLGNVEIIDLSDPANPERVGDFHSNATFQLPNTNGVAAFEVGTKTYAAVTSADFVDIPLNGIRVLELADRAAPRFTAPAAPATLEFDLAVTDAASQADTDSVTVAVRDPFVTTWNTTAANQAIKIDVGTSTAPYDVDWGDGSAQTGVTGDQTHTYGEAGIHTVSITGGLEQFRLGDTDRANRERLASIEQWGDVGWTGMRDAFRGASNMAYNAADSPDLSGVTDMGGMFREATAFNGDISGWDTSGITDMSDAFNGARSFNRTLSDWNTSSVTDMGNMFNGAHAFNGDISGWDTSRVTDMGGMFNGAIAFNRDINTVTDTATGETRWDTSSVTDMGRMFSGAAAFNGNVSAWDTSSVTDMNRMFFSAQAFDQDIGAWDVSAATDMDRMLTGATAFSQNLGKWYVTLDTDAPRVSDTDRVAGTISAQNSVLDGHSPSYAAAAEGDSAKFEVTAAKVLRLKDGQTVTPDTTLEVTVTVNGTGVLGTGNSVTVPVAAAASANTAPTVNAGTDRAVNERTVVTLAGTATDPDTGDSLTYAWTVSPASPAITITNSDALSASFTAPEVTSDTDFVFTLTVNDGTVDATDTVTITVSNVNRAPTADAGADQAVNEREAVTFDGRGSSDPDGDDLTYSWSQTAGSPTASPTSTDGPILAFVAPEVSSDAVLTFTLTVSDGGSLSGTDTVNVTIRNVNLPPTADAGADQAADENTVVTLDGSGSSDPDGDRLLYSWKQTAGSPTVSLSSNTAQSPTFTAPAVNAETALTFRLAVSDGTADVDTDTVVVTVRDVSDLTVSAGADRDVDEGDTVTLAATVSNATLRVTFEWTTDSSIAISDDDTRSASFTAPMVDSDTDYTFTVTATDGNKTATDSVVITVLDVPLAVDAGEDRTADEGSTVDLAGTVEGASLQVSFAWTTDSGIALSGSGTRSASFTAPMVDADTQYTFTLTATDGAETASDTVTITVADSLPLEADAGRDRTVRGGDSVTLTGTVRNAASSSPTYSWTQTAGTPAVSLSGSSTPAATFTAPDDSATLTFRFAATSGPATAADDVTITVVAREMVVADAGPDQSVDPGDAVHLDGTRSAGEAPLAYSWTQTAGPVVLITAAGTASPSFEAPDFRASLTFELTVTDADGGTDTDTVTVTVRNIVPVAHAGYDRNVGEEMTGTLVGSRSYDPDGDPLTYSWTQTAGSPALALSDYSAANPTFAAPRVSADTPFTFRLTVSDGLASDTDTVVITVRDDNVNRTPDARSGPHQTVREGETVYLDGAGSSDHDTGDVLRYSWEQTAGSPEVALSDHTAASPTFVAPQVGSYTELTFTLTVSDGLATDTDTTTIRILDVPRNSPPAADAGADQTVTEGDTVRMYATRSSDPDDGDYLRYSWSQTAGPAVALSSTGSSWPTFTAPDVLSDTAVTFELTATDRRGATDTDTVTITILDVPETDADPILTIVHERASVKSGDHSTSYKSDARCWDLEDGDISNLVTTSVAFHPNGRATISYECTDSDGNRDTTVRIVAVSGSAPPALYLNGLPLVEVAQGSSYVDAGATCVDPEEGDISGRVRASGTVDTSRAGTYTVFYSCYDGDGNGDTGVRIVIVQPAGADLAPRLTVPGDVTVAVGGSFTPPAATCTDAEDGDITHKVGVDDSAVDTSTPGRYTVFYTCADSADNFVSGSLYVSVNP